jgi:hypothetical protein
MRMGTLPDPSQPLRDDAEQSDALTPSPQKAPPGTHRRGTSSVMLQDTAGGTRGWPVVPSLSRCQTVSGFPAHGDSNALCSGVRSLPTPPGPPTRPPTREAWHPSGKEIGGVGDGILFALVSCDRCDLRPAGILGQRMLQASRGDKEGRAAWYASAFMAVGGRG